MTSKNRNESNLSIRYRIQNWIFLGQYKVKTEKLLWTHRTPQQTILTKSKIYGAPIGPPTLMRPNKLRPYHGLRACGTAIR